MKNGGNTQATGAAQITEDKEAAAKAAAAEADRLKAEQEQLAFEKAEAERREKEANKKDVEDVGTTRGAKPATKEELEESQLAKAAATMESIRAARAKLGQRYYRAVFGGPMVDLETNKVFTGEGTKSPMTGWLEAQIDAGKIEEVKED